MENHMQPAIRFTSKPTNATLTFGVFNGQLSLSIFPKREEGVKNGPMWGQNFQAVDVAKIIGILKELETSIAPGNQKAVTLTTYNGEKFVPSATICFGTEDKGIKYIEVQFRDKAQAQHMLRFAISTNNVLSDAGADFNFATKTNDGVTGLLWWMDKILPQMMYQTNGTQTRRGGGGGGGGQQF